MRVTDFNEPVIALVMFENPEVARPGKFFQVTINPLEPQQLSQSKKFIRFGNHQGDELVGWQRVSDLLVVEVIAVFDSDERVQKCDDVNLAPTIVAADTPG